MARAPYLLFLCVGWFALRPGGQQVPSAVCAHIPMCVDCLCLQEFGMCCFSCVFLRLLGCFFQWVFVASYSFSSLWSLIWCPVLPLIAWQWVLFPGLRHNLRPHRQPIWQPSCPVWRMFLKLRLRLLLPRLFHLLWPRHCFRLMPSWHCGSCNREYAAGHPFSTAIQQFSAGQHRPLLHAGFQL